MKDDVVFERIAEALLCDYSSVYYVDAVTNEYVVYSLDPEFSSLKIDFKGVDFFKQLIPDCEKVVHPDDRHVFKEDIQKENLLRDMDGRDMQNITYRLMINGKPVWHQLRLIRGVGGENEYFVLGVKNIDEQYRLKLDAERLGRERLIFDQIAHSLASRYDTIYYVDSETDEYSEFSASDPYKELNIPKAGDDFFIESHKNLAKYVHPDDLDGVMHIVTKETILGRLESERMITAEYRLHLGGDYRYTRLSVLWASDRKHFILGIEDINEEKKRETEHQRELRSANEKAMNDELTGVKNMNAYHAAENDLQKAIDEGNIQPFALVICDLNDLKKVNDTYGHKAGDEYIRCACRMICSVFVNSPVFRIGGDEFVVILRRNDYTDRTELLSSLRDEVRGNAEKPKAPMIASGLAEYDPDHHTKVSQVFELADDRMYCNKKELKVMYEGR